MLRPLEGEAGAQRRLGVGVTAAPQGPPRMLRPLEGEAGAQRRLGGVTCLVIPADRTPDPRSCCYGSVIRMSRTVSNRRSIWAFSMMSGGDIAMVSPVVRIRTPLS